MHVDKVPFLEGKSRDPKKAQTSQEDEPTGMAGEHGDVFQGWGLLWDRDVGLRVALTFWEMRKRCFYRGLKIYSCHQRCSGSLGPKIQ